MKDPATLRRLNWGCGLKPVPGWLNSDRRAAEGIDLVADIRHGLPLDDGCVDYAVAIHALQDLAWLEIVPALKELRRVLRPGGVLRLGLPDMDRAIAAWRRGDAAYFHVPDHDAASIGGKLVAQLIWYGSTRTPMNADAAREFLERAGYCEIRRCSFRETASRYPEIVSLDDRERESLFMEAVAG
jgi:predicted SAM-dependent methyltransferase